MVYFGEKNCMMIVMVGRVHVSISSVVGDIGGE